MAPSKMTNEAIAYCTYCDIVFGTDENAYVANAIHHVEYHAHEYTGHPLINVNLEVYNRILHLGYKGVYEIKTLAIKQINMATSRSIATQKAF